MKFMQVDVVTLTAKVEMHPYIEKLSFDSFSTFQGLFKRVKVKFQQLYDDLVNNLLMGNLFLLMHLLRLLCIRLCRAYLICL